jgi:hypothetical protein
LPKSACRLLFLTLVTIHFANVHIFGKQKVVARQNKMPAADGVDVFAQDQEAWSQELVTASGWKYVLDMLRYSLTFAARGRMPFADWLHAPVDGVDGTIRFSSGHALLVRGSEATVYFRSLRENADALRATHAASGSMDALQQALALDVVVADAEAMSRDVLVMIRYFHAFGGGLTSAVAFTDADVVYNVLVS